MTNSTDRGSVLAMSLSMAYAAGFAQCIIQYRPVIRKPDIRKSGYKKGTGRVPANLLCVIT
jgi:hypothetical protein